MYMLFIAYDEDKDTELVAKLESDITWFDAPVSIQPGTHQATGRHHCQRWTEAQVPWT